MSDLFFEIMNLQPNENEFMDAVRDSNSKETAYKLGFMHGRSYAAKMADEHESRGKKGGAADAVAMDRAAPAPALAKAKGE